MSHPHPFLPIRQEIVEMDSHPITAVYQGISDLAGLKDVIPLWFGEGDLDTPDFICEAAKASLDAKETYYGFAAGRGSLKHAICDYTNRHYGAALDTSRVTVPGSAMLSLTIALNSLIETGDNVVIVSPIWPNIFMATTSVGAQPRFVRLSNRAEDGSLKPWSLDLDELFDACDARTKAIFISSPGNPTGWVISEAEQRAIMEFARTRRIAVISDEVYHRLIYDRPVAPSFVSVAEDEDPLYIIHSFSKAWAMTGWRLGWLIHPASLSGAMGVQSGVFNTGATSFIQAAGVAALNDGDAFVDGLVERFAKGRDIVMHYLGDHPRIRLTQPQGAFYAFPEIDGLTDSLAFCRQLLVEHKIGLAPGSGFGPDNEACVRLCFAQSHQRLEMALERLVKALN